MLGLQRTKLFELGGELLAGATHLFTTESYCRRDALFRVGDESRVVHFIRSGRIRLSRVSFEKREVALAILGPGDIVGEEVLFGRLKRATVATCMEDSIICSSQADKVLDFMSTQPAFVLTLARYLSQRHESAMAMIEDMAVLSVSDRLVNIFGRLARDFGVLAPEGIKIDVQLTQADLAALIGSTRETVSFEMSKLARQDRLRVSHRKFVLPPFNLDRTNLESAWEGRALQPDPGRNAIATLHPVRKASSAMF